jgi:hypothetical protein
MFILADFFPGASEGSASGFKGVPEGKVSIGLFYGIWRRFSINPTATRRAKKEGRLGLSEVKFGATFNPTLSDPSGIWVYLF